MTQAAHAISPTGTCPYHADIDDRKSAAAAAASEERVRRLANGGVKIESFALTRKILRGGGTRQAGFLADLVMKASKDGSTPVLFQEGEVHQKQRAANRPLLRAAHRHQPLSRDDERAERRPDEPAHPKRQRRSGGVEHGDGGLPSRRTSSALTNSSLTGMSKRLNRFFASGIVKKTTRLRKILRLLRQQLRRTGLLLDGCPSPRSTRGARRRRRI